MVFQIYAIVDAMVNAMVKKYEHGKLLSVKYWQCTLNYLNYGITRGIIMYK